ncbi:MULTISPECIES: helix-turn-helix transcriptional regulator [unclassified Rhizobium]|jgi:AraC-like DNA-binding protein|uniref:helix-turn-helix domain-containing protein n=1 Tax=unclassified Rhizobium TaxID=2613769 RepID=UPI00064833F4|nr:MULTISPECIES: helix-turn-helix transcriptional regulator [unclassified Rhizobium]OJY78595.1 MAG: hypothetical protein BGP09_02235 [Rhizobium sp. 60-20]RKD51973.1 AraC family transcriptional regulator [Rhizobium sp. WW_1]
MRRPTLTQNAIASFPDDEMVLAVEWHEDAARKTSMHAHAAGQIIGSREGLLSVRTTSGWWIVPRTHSIWMPPHVPHAVHSHGPFRGWSIYVSQRHCEALPTLPKTLYVSSLLEELVRRAVRWDNSARTPSQRHLAQVIVDEIAELREDPLGLPNPSSGPISRVTDQILANLSDDRSINELAALGGLSARTLARLFTRETGMGMVAWRQRAKVLSAIAMLADGAPVTMIALDLGYDNVSAFIAMFRRVMGVTPGQYQSSGGLHEMRGRKSGF